MIQELKEYATDVDVSFVRRAVQAIGHCAIKLERGADRCVDALMDLIRTKIPHITQEVGACPIRVRARVRVRVRVFRSELRRLRVRVKFRVRVRFRVRV